MTTVTMEIVKSVVTAMAMMLVIAVMKGIFFPNGK